MLFRNSLSLSFFFRVSKLVQLLTRNTTIPKLLDFSGNYSNFSSTLLYFPSSIFVYVKGDQASIIGGAIEFVRELEQLLQCLESQKRRRLLGEAQARQVGDPSLATQQQPPFFPPLPIPNEQMKLVEMETGLHEETAESKSCLADVEVKLLGFDAMIKILSRRRPGQLIKTIAALEDLQLIILHTNITTIEQTVLYSFNVKVYMVPP